MTVSKEFEEASARACIRALRGLEQTAIMLEKWGPETFPTNERGQVHFGRAMTDSAAESIREAWKIAIAEVEHFPDSEANWIVERGALRNAVLQMVVELGAARRIASTELRVMGHLDEALRLAHEALKSNIARDHL